MRRSREDALETRARIVEEAARLFRLRGVGSTSVADVMSAVGLTVGGFYRHFENKDELVAEAIAFATRASLGEGDTQPGGNDPAALLSQYLSRAHLEHPERGCPVAALCFEASQGPAGVKRAFTDAVERLVATIASGLPTAQADNRADSLALAASLVGALSIGRAVDDPHLADDVLRAVLRHWTR